MGPNRSSRSLAVVGLFSALYIISSGIVSYITQLGYPEHLLRGFLMTALILQTRRKWSATMMGTVCGVVFLLAVGSPAPYLLPSTFVSGFVFDLALMTGSFFESVRSVSKMLIGVAVSGAAESLVALAIITSFGVFGARPFEALSAVWSIDVILNIILSCLGAILAIRFFARAVLPH